MAKQEKYGFIIHPEEWKMVRDVMTTEAISKALFPVLDACLLQEDPSESIGDLINHDLCARMFWDRNVRDIGKYEKERAESKVRWERFKAKRNALQPLATVGERCNGENAPNTNTNTNTDTNTNININRSVTVTVAEEPNGNGNRTGFEGKIELMPGGKAEARKLAEKFAAAVRKDQGAFFDPEFDAITILAAVTGDFKSLKRWRQLALRKGDAEVRTEAFTFWREISAGEDVANRGSALNRRLANLPDRRKAE